MAGGSGTRLWPLSRALRPKQFINIRGEQSLLQDTAVRLQGLDCAAPIVICNDAHRFFVAQQLVDIGIHAKIVLEPVGKNTAPAIALAALTSAPDKVLLVLSADHVIGNLDRFHQAIQSATHLAEKGYFATFGVVPTAPHTGYGYIKKAEALDDGFQVAQFVEKPDLDTAQAYLESGDYLWNSGMFAFKASDYIAAMERHAADIMASCRAAIDGAKSDMDFIRPDVTSFAACRSDSVDYALMEKADNVVTVPFDGGWSDVGSWDALWEIGERDEQGNHIDGDVIAVDTHDSYVRSRERLVATLGVRDLVVVDTKDAVLVAQKDKVQDIKAVVAELKRRGSECADLHREVHRPWGKYDSVDRGERYQVKRITVNPGAKLSVQKHFRRAEHWVVVSGTAEVSLDGVTSMLNENESIYIPVESIHSLKNPTQEPLEIIEIQTGGYLGEDDIERLEDVYGRVDTQA